METEQYLDRAEAQDAPAEPLPVEEERPTPFNFQEKFWLALPYGSPDFAAAVVERFGDHESTWESANICRSVWNAYRAYHSLGATAEAGADPITTITESGEDGEFLTMRMNNYRGLIKHQIALLTSNQPAWDPQARNTDSESSRQCSVARGICDYAMDTKGLRGAFAETLENAKVAASSFTALGWNENVGLNKAGDIWHRILCPWEVTHESVRHYRDCTWWIFRAYESRWDWVAKFAASDPEKAERIAAMDSSTVLDKAREASTGDQSDRIPVLYVYARPTLACPEGRVAIIAGEDETLMDVPSPYGDEMPIERLCPATFVGTSVPYADSWSLLAPDEAYNAMLSMVITRVDTFGIPNVTAPQGSEYKISDFSGNQVLETPPGNEKPEVLDLLRIPPELANAMNIVKSGMEELSGINSVTRGNPTENVSSGSYAALLQSMAVQFNSADEAAYIEHQERIMTHVIRIYQRCATETQMVSICGEDEAWTVSEFQSEDLDRIQRVAIKPMNILSKTVGGRMDMADKLLERGLIEDPREYLQVVKTGNITPLYAGPARELENIKSENERMTRGEQVGVLWLDNHQLHIREHRCQLDTAGRYDPKHRDTYSAHIMEHVKIWANLSRESPDQLFAIGCPPLPGAMAVGQQAAAMGGGAPAPGAEGPLPQKQPNTEPSKAKPGPQGGPKESGPGGPPKMPEPAKTPAGERVA